MDGIRAACAALDVPQLYAGSGAAIETDRLTRQAAETWVDTLLPLALDRLQAALDAVHSSLPNAAVANEQKQGQEGGEPLRTDLMQVVTATSRLLAPGGIELVPAGEEACLSPPHVVDEPLWYVGSAASAHKARKLRRCALDRLAQLPAASGAAVGETEVAVTLLREYIKPLFSAPKGVNQAGRARKMPVGIVDVRGDPSLHDMRMAEEMVWKGGAPYTGRFDAGPTAHAWARTAELDPDLHLAPDVGSLLCPRHTGIGAVHVVAWCASVLGPALDRVGSATAEEASLWWSLMLPPLVSLLEDADLRVRLVAVRAMYAFLLAPGMRRWKQDERGEATAITLLRRSGLAPLLQGQVDTNLSLLSQRLTPALVWDSVCAGRALALLTTMPDAPALPNGDQNKDTTPRAVLRFDRLYHLLTRALVRPIVFIPVPHAPFALPPPRAPAPAGTQEMPSSEAKQTQLNNLATLRALFTAAPVLLSDVGPGGAGRLFDSLCEALVGVLASVRPLAAPRADPTRASAFQLGAPLDRRPQSPYAQVAEAVVQTLRTLVQLAAPATDTDTDTAADGDAGGDTARMAPPLVERAGELVGSAAGVWVGFELFDDTGGGGQGDGRWRGGAGAGAGVCARVAGTKEMVGTLAALDAGRLGALAAGGCEARAAAPAQPQTPS